MKLKIAWTKFGVLEHVDADHSERGKKSLE